MNNKERIQMLEKWVKDINPKAFLHPADGRCGGYYAIATSDGCAIHTWTQFMAPKEMEQALILYFDNNFAKIKNA